MKLLVVSTWLPWPLDNGSRVRAYRLLERLSQRHAITLLAFAGGGAAGALDPLRAICDRLEVVRAMPLRGGRLGWRGLLSAVPRHFVQTDSAEMRRLVAGCIDGHDAAIGMQVDAARYLAGHPRIPRVFEEAEVGVLRDPAMREPGLLRRLRRRATWWKSSRFVRSLVNTFTRTTVASELERGYLVSIGCDARRIAVVPNGAEATTVQARRPSSSRLIYPGAVTYSANLDAVRFFAREVLPLVRNERPEVSLTVTGETEGADIGDVAAIPGVTFTGCLPDVAPEVAGSAVCVVPLRIGGGTRLKVLQAMALGTPVVSTTKGIEGLDVVPETHVLVADTAGAFAAQVLRLLEDADLRHRLVEASAALVRDRYSWDRIGDLLERVVEQAVRDHAQGQLRQAA